MARKFRIPRNPLMRSDGTALPFEEWPPFFQQEYHRVMASQGGIQTNLRDETKHPKQAEFINCEAKRIIICAGRRSGKTVGLGMRAVKRFLKGRRVLYGAPTSDQLHRFWTEVVRALEQPIEMGILKKNETERTIELPGTEQRIKAKTCWNADTLRGDYADDLILDEWQLMNEDTWGVVGAPMLADNNGDAIFAYTPPSLHSRSVAKADDPRHAIKMFLKARANQTGRWQTFHFTSKDNPTISAEALDELTEDMTQLAYRMEIEAENIEEAPGALWTQKLIDSLRVSTRPESFNRVVVAVDPSASSTGDEAGIITVGAVESRGYVLADDSVRGSPSVWANAAVRAYHREEADCIVAEKNNGGEMVLLTIATADPNVPVRLVHASRGKQTRAEPVAAIYEQGRGHHVGNFPLLESEMVLWTPGDPSPNRMDAMVWAFAEHNLYWEQFKQKTPHERQIEQLPSELQPSVLESLRGTPEFVDTYMAQRHALALIRKKEEKKHHEELRRMGRWAGRAVSHRRVRTG